MKFRTTFFETPEHSSKILKHFQFESLGSTPTDKMMATNRGLSPVGGTTGENQRVNSMHHF